MEHYRKGYIRAFTEIVRRYERELLNYLRQYLGKDASYAEDVCQDTFLQLHLKLGLYEHGRRVRPWLYTIATHQAIDAIRKVRRHHAASLDAQPVVQNTDGEVGTFAALIEGKEPEPSTTLETKEQQEWVRASLERLPPIFREPLTLLYFQGLTYLEIAERLDIPIGTVKSRLHVAIIKLREQHRKTFGEAA